MSRFAFGALLLLAMGSGSACSDTSERIDDAGMRDGAVTPPTPPAPPAPPPTPPTPPSPPPTPPTPPAPPPPTDAGVDAFADSAVVDAGPACGSPRTAEIAELCGATVLAGTPTTMRLYADGCFCGETFACRASIVSDGFVELDFEVCTSELLCDGCYVGEADCTLPALPAGAWPLRQGGRTLGVIDVLEGDPSPPGFVECLTTAPAVDGSLFCPTSGRAAQPDQVCFDGTSFGQLRTFQITEMCPGCFDNPGDCEVIVQPGSIRLAPSIRACDCPTCGACAPGCYPKTVECALPTDLMDGVYRLYVGDRDYGDVEVGSDGGWCTTGTAGGGGSGPGRPSP